MIYAEFIERDRSMPIEIFHFLGDQASWKDPEDRLFASLARTMRLGPQPDNLAFWQCKGIARLEEWEAYFRSEEGLRNMHEMATLRALNLKEAGCYDEIVQGPEPREGLQFVEFFDFGAETGQDNVAEHFNRRAEKYEHATLNIVMRRIGLLGPARFGDMAVWTFPGYAALEEIAREQHAEGPLRPHMVGVYRHFGSEIL